VGQVVNFSRIPLDVGDFPTRHPYGLGLWREQIERILADWVGELDVPIYRGREVTGFAQDDTGVDVKLSGGQSLRAEYLAGCDGGGSLIREAAGIEFPGWEPTTSSVIVEAEMDEPDWGIRRDGKGLHYLRKLDGGGRARVLVREQHLGQTGEPTLRDLSQALIAGRCCSTSGSPAVLTSRHGGTGFSWSTPHTRACGSFRSSARSPLPLPC
jgi:2-polyprenyl-6-methoxyphenol hydroxylase-like FAD-dependent oxidoreductase